MRRLLRPAALALLVLPVLALALAAPASARIRLKIDDYEVTHLPAVRLWVSVLDGDAPLDPKSLDGFDVRVDGEPLGDRVQAKPYNSMERPMAAVLVVDARYSQAWTQSLEAMSDVFGKLPGDSRVLAVAAAQEPVPLPAEAWASKPAELLPTLRGKVDPAGGGRPTMAEALRVALSRFPLAADADPDEADDIPIAKDDPEDPLPADRVLFLVGDGQLGRLGQTSLRRTLQTLVTSARRRGVRIMAIGTGENPRQHATLRVLARKTGGTFRRARDGMELAERAQQSLKELEHRYRLEFDVPGLRRGDDLDVSVQAYWAGGMQSEPSRPFTLRAEHELTFTERVIDWISDQWEKAPWWVRAIVIAVIALILGLIVLLILIKKARKAKKARTRRKKVRQAKLAQRKPCPACQQTTMPGWKQCLFCGADLTGTGIVAPAQQGPQARYRLTGRAGDHQGRALRFMEDMVTLGRGARCQVPLTGRDVSPEHCAVRDRGDEFVLIDLNSQTGTFVNNERVQRVRLREGDIIRVGGHEFVFGVEG
ncbi:MAG: FHA domain-containing protein [Myxococcales bacterium]|nr:FHA domain-containing protein [Myxococcales bacterium]MCB9526575.1 FHA domain-containing protein [Myxococcales bacterium]